MSDSFQNLISLLHHYAPSQAQTIELSRGDYLSQAGERNQDVFLINDGAVHAYLLNDGEEQSIRFGYKGSVMVSIDSYYSGAPSNLYLQAIRKSNISRFSSTDLKQILETNAEYERLYSVALENLVLQQHEREIDLLCSSPAERYKRVLERSPAVFQEIPAKYIASYLRMTPETLSRLRKS